MPTTHYARRCYFDILRRLRNAHTVENTLFSIKITKRIFNFQDETFIWCQRLFVFTTTSNTRSYSYFFQLQLLHSFWRSCSSYSFRGNIWAAPANSLCILNIYSSAKFSIVGLKLYLRLSDSSSHFTKLKHW